MAREGHKPSTAPACCGNPAVIVFCSVSTHLPAGDEGDRDGGCSNRARHGTTSTAAPACLVAALIHVVSASVSPWDVGFRARAKQAAWEMAEPGGRVTSAHPFASSCPLNGSQTIQHLLGLPHFQGENHRTVWLGRDP